MEKIDNRTVRVLGPLEPSPKMVPLNGAQYTVKRYQLFLSQSVQLQNHVVLMRYQLYP